ncbi:MAG: peptidoglycan DD-metalloendopeptidase family protein [Chloroflexi bacterium]|nr:peptidoglycan DD-metalloendopeptidase family protein [Chloroflexota bacterium]
MSPSLMRVLAGALLLSGLIVLIAFWQAPSVAPIVLGPPTAFPTPTEVETPSPGPTSTPESTPLPTVSGPQEHYWLARPIAPPAYFQVDRYYPYASRGDGSLRVHHGVEFQNPEGVPVLAVADGTVVVAGSDPEEIYGVRYNFYGNLVVVELDRRYAEQPVYVLYAHLSRVDVSTGQHLKQGEVIGAVGRSGAAFGPHLHLEVRLGHNRYFHTRNPELWLRPLPGRGVIAGRLVHAQGAPVPEASIEILTAADPPPKAGVWARITTYARFPSINADERWGENFAIGDVPTGEYIVQTRLDGRLYQARVSVQEGRTAFVELQLD